MRHVPEGLDASPQVGCEADAHDEAGQDSNIAVRSELKTLLKRMAEKPADKDVMRLTVSELDRAVKKGVIKKAVANRRKSRMALAANRAKAPAKK
jgi:ribosomal protein S20